jgi:hypothetical protein
VDVYVVLWDRVMLALSESTMVVSVGLRLVKWWRGGERGLNYHDSILRDRDCKIRKEEAIDVLKFF